MHDYTYTEIGMLTGTALGGLLAVIGFSVTGRILYLLVSAIAIALGIVVGNYMDRKLADRTKNDHAFKHKDIHRTEFYGKQN